jgi:hypothetical protein
MSDENLRQHVLDELEFEQASRRSRRLRGRSRSAAWNTRTRPTSAASAMSGWRGLGQQAPRERGPGESYSDVILRLAKALPEG